MLGSNQWRDMQGAEIAQKHHIVVVSVAYRLGVFGYMHNKAFMDEDGVMGNWGSLDQRKALEWVNKHIGSVGGNNHDVTISGCSAGGQSTQLHLVSPDSWSYFHRVIAFSAPNGIVYKNLTEAENLYGSILDELDCCAGKVNFGVFQSFILYGARNYIKIIY